MRSGNYLSANYTHVAREVHGARRQRHRPSGGAARERRADAAISVQTDVTVDLLPLVEAARAAGRDIVHRRRDARADAVHDRSGAGRAGALRFPHRCSALRLRPVRSAESRAQQRRSRHRHVRQQPSHRMAERCRSVSARWAMRSCTRCFCVTSKTPPGAPRSKRSAPARAAALHATRTAAMRPSRKVCSPPARCSSTSSSSCTAPGSCGGSCYDSLAVEKLLAAGELNERFDERVLGSCAASVSAGAQRGGVRGAAAHGVFREEVEYEPGRLRARGGGMDRRGSGRTARAARASAAECLGRGAA